jgi:hypothetical protein
MTNSKSKKMWVKPEVTGISAMGDAKTIDSKQYFPQEGTFDGVTYIGPAS